jgi:hypothetical protein
MCYINCHKKLLLTPPQFLFEITKVQVFSKKTNINIYIIAIIEKKYNFLFK